MREIRPSGLEGGVRSIPHPYPYQNCSPASVASSAPSAVKSPWPCFEKVQAEFRAPVFFASLAPFRGEALPCPFPILGGAFTADCADDAV